MNQQPNRRRFFVERPAPATRPAARTILTPLGPNLFCLTDTCNVYILRRGEQAVLVDFGSGAVLPLLAGLGIRQVSAVLLTHHHRDQAQGLPQAAAAGIPIWAPQAERELFAAVDHHWQGRALYANYNLRQDRFSLLEPVSLAGLLHDYAQYEFCGLQFTVIPTPGHTPGSLSLLVEIDGRQVAFTGDLIYGPGQVWSLAATQWSYSGAEGVAASILSLLDLKARRPDLLLPSHGAPLAVSDSATNRNGSKPTAIDLLVERLRQLLELRGDNPRLFDLIDQPYEPITPRLLRNRTSLANSYVLLSHTGKALLIDFGYDFMVGAAPGADRAARRPWLYTLPALQRQWGVTSISAAIPTHYHDDHVAGLNLLRQVTGTQVWAPANIAPILADPARWDLPCLWYDPIPVDRVLPFEQPLTWEEYELTLYPLPGHTCYAAAIAVTVDGQRVLFTGDQYQDGDGRRLNYVYQNRFEPTDYRLSAELYRRLAPDLILSGHWDPLRVTPAYLEHLARQGAALERLHQDLLPSDLAGFGSQGCGPEGCGLRIQPYQAQVRSGQILCLEVEVRNPFPTPETAQVHLALPRGWQVAEKEIQVVLPPGGSATVQFHVTPPAGMKQRRARTAADLTIGGRRFGQQAEALITVED